MLLRMFHSNVLLESVPPGLRRSTYGAWVAGPGRMHNSLVLLQQVGPRKRAPAASHIAHLVSHVLVNTLDMLGEDILATEGFLARIADKRSILVVQIAPVLHKQVGSLERAPARCALPLTIVDFLDVSCKVRHGLKLGAARVTRRWPSGSTGSTRRANHTGSSATA